MDSAIKAEHSAYQSAVDNLDEISSYMLKRTAYPAILKQLAERSPSLKFWFTEFSPLVDYDVRKDKISNGLKGTRLINFTSSRSANAESAICKPENNADERETEDHAVTAIYLSGYSLANPAKKDECKHEIIRLAGDALSATNPGSPFSHKRDMVDAEIGHYINFIESGEKNKDVPNYAVKFMLVLPLKEPISVPELPVEDK